MCEQSVARDPEIVALCKNLIKSQTDEIIQMREILKRY
jgi:uncharacterized protein (DUF305 family)